MVIPLRHDAFESQVLSANPFPAHTVYALWKFYTNSRNTQGTIHHRGDESSLHAQGFLGEA